MVEVAVVGLGRMGGAMARKLHGAGHEVTVFNRTRARAEALADELGERAVGTAREAAHAPLVVSSLADDAAVAAAYEGPDGLLAGLGAGTVVVETSTVDPDTVVSIGPRVAETGASLLDAPVSGSVPAVEAGGLAFMVGGDAAAIERAAPVLDVLGKRTFHLGDIGTGAAMKLAVNGVVHALNAALSEALVLAERAGIDREIAWEVFGAGAAGAPFVTYKRAAFMEPEATPPAFSLELVAKDLELITGLADRLGVPAEQARTNLALARRATDDGHGDRDMSWLAQILRDAEADMPEPRDP
jgi:3-hydroxyisobutyrate dehydrogenase-like beta-hydroxyacid dehydrogenase